MLFDLIAVTLIIGTATVAMVYVSARMRRGMTITDPRYNRPVQPVLDETRDPAQDPFALPDERVLYARAWVDASK